MVRYVMLQLFTVFRKVFGLVWYYFVVPFRSYARNVVYNYVLQNGTYLRRLLERHPHISADNTHYIIDPYHGAEGGIIKYRKISKVEYYLVFWLIWGWVDDDSNNDTYDRGYIESIVKRERMTWLPEWFVSKLKVELQEESQFGNSFDLGDSRVPDFRPLSATLWNIRNTAYNFQYIFDVSKEQEFLYAIGGRSFGWIPEDFGGGYKMVVGKKLK